MRTSVAPLLLLAVGWAACGPIPAPGPVVVALDPWTATLPAGGTKDFKATVTGATDTSVKWSVREANGGSVSGGHYTAPQVAGTYHVIATSNADPTKSASATVSVTALPEVAIAVSPTTADVGFQQTQQFTASVTHTTDTQVSWAVMEGGDGGSISPAGLYTAPLVEGTFHVVATAHADPTKSAVATVTVHTAVMVSPVTATLNPLQTQAFSATVPGGGGVMWTVVEGALGGSIDADGVYTASPAVGVYHVVATSLADPSVFGAATVTVTLNPQVGVTVAPATATLDEGEVLQLSATVANATDTRVTWSVREGVGGGTVTAGGAYAAPNHPGVYHVVAESAADPVKSGQATVTVNAVAVALNVGSVSVPAGGTQDFSAVVTGTVDPGVAWTVSPGGGTIDASGHYTAPVAGGTYTVTATSTYDPSKSASATVDVTPVVVAITSAPSGAVDQGSSFTFAGAATGGVDGAVTWSATCGAFSSGTTWTAPASAGTCVVTATSVLDPSKSASVSVTVSPVVVTLTASPSGPVDEGSSFTFAVSVTGSVNTSYAWTATCGSFAGDVWTAPTQAGPCTLTATSNADASKSAGVTVTVKQPVVTLTSVPSNAVDQGSTFTFAATVTGAVNTAVTWQASCGSFAGAVWTAPAAQTSCAITAVSVSDSTATAATTVSVKAVTVSLTSTTAGPVEQGASFTFAASVAGAVGTGVTWSATCGSLSGSTWTAPAAQGSCTVTATSTWDVSASASQVVSVPAVTVVVSPAAAQVGPSQLKGFVAVVTGTVDHRVSWSVDPGGAGGTVSAMGVYLAPASAGADAVRATSVADPSKSGTAAVTVSSALSVAVSPATVALGIGQSQAFAATVSGSANGAVSWTVQGGAANGTITPSGVYSAPPGAGTYTVVATALADGTTTGTATVNVSATQQVTVAVTPSSASVGLSGAVDFSAAVSGSANTAVTWSVPEGPSGGAIDASGHYVAPAVPGTFHVVAASAADPTRTGVATVTVGTGPPISVSVSPASATLPPGGAADFTATVSGTPNPLVTWSATCGTVDASGHYLAPASGNCTVTASSVADGSRSGSAQVTVTSTVSVAVLPPLDTVAFGDTEAFAARVLGATSTAVTWSIVANPGDVGSVGAATGVYDSSLATRARPFTFVLKALSAADGTTFGTATVTVVDSPVHAVSGTVSSASAKGPGRVYLTVTDSGGTVLGGTSLAAPGPYRIRCLTGGGTFTLTSWRDLDGVVRPNFAADPFASTSFVATGTADVTGVDLALTDPSLPAPGATQVKAQPFEGGALVSFGRLVDVNGFDQADHYDVYLSPLPNPGPANNVFSRQVRPSDLSLAVATGLTDGTPYYAAVRAVSSGGAGPLTNAGPVTPGPGAGAFTVTGQVSLPASSTSGPLFVGLSLPTGQLWGTQVASPSALQGFSIPGVPAGTYKLFVLHDRNGDGVVGPLDPTVDTSVTVASSLDAGTLTLAGGKASLQVGTLHQLDQLYGPLTQRYYLDQQVTPLEALPVRAVLLGGVQETSVPYDVGVLWTQGGPELLGRRFLSLPSTPTVGDGYQVAVYYADGSAEVLGSPVTAVLQPPQTLAPSGAGAGLTPTFTWAAPSPPPAGTYTYELFVVQLPGYNPLWWANRMSSSTFSVPYAGPSLSGTNTYGFTVLVRDEQGNSASADQSFSP